MPGGERERIDVLLVERGLATSRSKAQALVLAGDVTSAGQRIDKPGRLVPRDANLVVKPRRRWVGRGALKLAPALDAFRLDPADRRILDVGSSTGGFTELLLDRGAREVVALDVGRNQLDWSVRSDPRVHVLEGVNARYLTADQLPFVPDWAVADVSFISLQRVLPPVAACLAAGGTIVALVKPQFEVGKHQVGRGGLVRDPSLHGEVLRRLTAFAHTARWSCRGICPAGLRGAEGNQEYFLHLSLTPGDGDTDKIEAWIDAALRSAGEAP